MLNNCLGQGSDADDANFVLFEADGANVLIWVQSQGKFLSEAIAQAISWKYQTFDAQFLYI